ncbi:MAG: SBBP repeat-containing protein [Deltaproteobacteria bacterium]|nr:SBBP repeat-containing protein [Deltaproteobacteria bacterium]
MKKILGIAVVCSFLASCVSDGKDGVSGSTSLVELSDEEAGENCINGGVRVSTGMDENGDGVLDTTEVSSVRFVCNPSDGDNGINGTNSMVSITDEEPGENCAYGGKKIETGMDENGNAFLDEMEVDSVEYVCNGNDGLTTLISVTDEEPGENCTHGGKKIETGSDLDNSSTLDEDEISATSYICNGNDALSTLVAVTDEEPGVNCINGGKKIDTGSDLDGNSVLDPLEVENTSYVCNGEDGDEYAVLVKVSDEPQCETADGQRIDTGFDLDGNGLLDTTEITSTDYINCSGVVLKKVVQWGSVSDDTSSVVAVDGSGNVYVAGRTDGDLYGQVGGMDVFLTKFNSSGNEIWGTQWGTSESDVPYAVAVDTDGNIYVAGITFGDLYGQVGGMDVFLTKFDSSGNELWGTQWGTTSNEIAEGLAIDADGNVYVTGRVYAADLYGQVGGVDAFLTKLDSSGNELWGRQWGTAVSDVSCAVAIDAEGSVYVAGQTYGDLYGQVGGNDAFLTKFDSSGNELWGRQWGSPGTETVYDVASDADGNIYVAGYILGNLYGQVGSNDAFLTKFDSSGNELWGRQWGSSESDFAYAMAVNAEGNVFVTGYTRGDMYGSSLGGHDGFLTGFNEDGIQITGKQFGTAADDTASGLAIDNNGHIFLVGYTAGTFPEQTSAGGDDVFMMIYSY